MPSSPPPPAAVLTLAVWMHDGQLVARVHASDPTAELGGRAMPSAVAGRDAITAHVDDWLKQLEGSRRDRDAT